MREVVGVVFLEGGVVQLDLLRKVKSMSIKLAIPPHIKLIQSVSFSIHQSQKRQKNINSHVNKLQYRQKAPFTQNLAF